MRMISKIVFLVVLLGMALAQTNIKFTLDFTVQGSQSPFFLAIDKGYYAAEKLNVTIDRGFGSADAIAKIAAGAYDMGFGDINSLMEFNARNPSNKLVAIYIVYDAPPHSVMFLKGKGINSPKDLEGKTLAAPAGDAARRLFPVFAEAVGIDEKKVNFINVDAPLREPTLARGQADAITGFYFTSFLNLKAAGVKAEDIVVFPYSDYIKNLYGNAVVVRPDFAAKNPDAVKGFLRALVKAWKDALVNPAESVASIKKRDGLINEALELERLQLTIKSQILTPDVKAFGFGQARRDRLVSAITLIKKAFELPATLKPEEVFTDKYLPPLAERRPGK